MLKQNKVFYNVVIDGDLFYTIYDYLRFNGEAIRNKHNIHSFSDFDSLTVNQFKLLALDAIDWLINEQLPKVSVLKLNDDSPNFKTWGTLYYQTLNYIGISGETYSIRKNTLENNIEMCKKAIEYLKTLVNEIRETTEEDI